MNYVKQGISFFELQLSNQISANAQALYYTLLNINNKCNWKERFTVANSMITAYTSLNTSAIQRARNELIQLGIIDYKKGNGNKCGEYLLFKLYPDFEQQTDSNANNKPIATCTANRQQCEQQTDTLVKQYKTKRNETNKEKESVKEKEAEKPKSVKKPYGEYARVFLSDDEYALLGKKYSNRDELIKFLDEYIEMKGGYDVKSHYAAINKWVVTAVREQKVREDRLKSASVKKGHLNNFKQDMPDFEAIEKVVLEKQRRF